MHGILNGTGNFILDRMDRFGMDFDEALKEAQALGYAEADPTADIAGFDVANKAVISASVACGAPFKDDFPVLGIEKVTKSFLDDLKREGKTLRHMMLFKRTNNRAALGVAPVVLPLESLEAQVRSNFNCVTLEGDLVGRLSFYGQGAGGRPTADAVLQDLTSIRTRRVEPLPVAAPPVYDAGLLRGAGLTAHGILPDRTLEELARAARETGEFMTFQPEP